VTLIERDSIGAHASGNNPGGLNPLYGPGIPGPLQALALEGFALHLAHWDDIRARAGFDFSGRRKRRVNLALDDDDLIRLAAMQEHYSRVDGFSARWLDPAELRALEPRIDAGVLRGLEAEGDARVAAPDYTRAVAAAAGDLGARVVSGDVRGLDVSGDRVTAVRLDSGPHACDAVVIATGPWCDGPADWLGVSLPMEPVRGEMLLVEVDGGAVDTDLAWRDVAAYRSDGTAIWLGGTEDHVGFDATTTEAGCRSILGGVSRFLPAVGSGHVLRQTAALRPLTPDGRPVVGLAPGWANVGLALGGGRKGMLFSAAMGRALADLLIAGVTELAIGPCAPDRFAPS
jgi:glycine oxidase